MRTDANVFGALSRYSRTKSGVTLQMHLHLAGHLAWYESQKRSRVEINLPHSTWLTDFLRDVGIPPGEIAIAVVNGVAVDLQAARVSDTDRVDLFPPVGGGK